MAGGTRGGPPDPDDGRGSRVLLTDKGRSLQDRVFRAFIAATTSLMAPLTQYQVRAADQSLGELLDLFEQRSSLRSDRNSG